MIRLLQVDFSLPDPLSPHPMESSPRHYGFIQHHNFAVRQHNRILGRLRSAYARIEKYEAAEPDHLPSDQTEDPTPRNVDTNAMGGRMHRSAEHSSVGSRRSEWPKDDTYDQTQQIGELDLPGSVSRASLRQSNRESSSPASITDENRMNSPKDRSERNGETPSPKERVDRDSKTSKTPSANGDIESDDDKGPLVLSFYAETGEKVARPDIDRGLFRKFVRELEEAMGVRYAKEPERYEGEGREWYHFAKRTAGCVMQFIRNTKTVSAKHNKEFAVCRNCFNKQKLCLRYHEDRGYYFVPLPASLRADIESTDIRYWVYDEQNAQRRIEKARGGRQIWS